MTLQARSAGERDGIVLEPLGLPFTALYALAAGHAVLPVLDGDPTAGAAAVLSPVASAGWPAIR